MVRQMAGIGMTIPEKPPGFSEQPQAFTYAALTAGIPASVVRGLERQGLRREDIRTIIPDRTLERRIAAGDNLKPEEADGIARLLRVIAHTRRVFDKPGSPDIFLREPHALLGGRTAIEASRTELGAREVEAILTRIEHGVFS
jgi:putative toxin-antitoxin system antitoxin component (TIGR02293 family)